MIFQETWERVLDGSKTQTRRVVKFTKPWGYAVGLTGGGQPWIINAWREVDCTYRVGHTYAVQPGRGQKSVGRITITAIRYCTRAGDISEQDAIAEGFESISDFVDAYEGINGTAALDAPCWAISFALVTP